MNRRDLLAKLAAITTGLTAPQVVTHKAAGLSFDSASMAPPAYTPLTEDEIIAMYAHLGEKEEDIPEGDTPAVHYALVALHDFLDHADAALVQHEIEEGDCDCDHCRDLEWMCRAVDLFESVLSSSTRGGGLYYRRKGLYRANCKARRAAKRAVEALEDKPEDRLPKPLYGDFKKTA